MSLAKSQEKKKTNKLAIISSFHPITARKLALICCCPVIWLKFFLSFFLHVLFGSLNSLYDILNHLFSCLYLIICIHCIHYINLTDLNLSFNSYDFGNGEYNNNNNNNNF